MQLCLRPELETTPVSYSTSNISGSGTVKSFLLQNQPICTQAFSKPDSVQVILMDPTNLLTQATRDTPSVCSWGGFDSS
jgi:hypothetical protein